MADAEKDLKTTKKKRSSLRNVITKTLVNKAKILRDIPTEQLTEENKNEAHAMYSTLKEKGDAIKLLDERILELIADDEIEADMESTTNFEINCAIALRILEKCISSTENKENEITNTNTQPSMSQQRNTVNVNLPTLTIPKFDGSPLKWQSFIDTFEASIGGRQEITDVQKFQYLCGYLTGGAKKVVEGFPLTSANYKKAVDLLKERYGNPQLIISAHITKIMECKKSSRNNVSELRNLLDTVESNVRSLENHGVNKEHFGALLIPILQEKIPPDIRLAISRSMGKEGWKIDNYLNAMKNEIEARDNCTIEAKSADSINDEVTDQPYTIQTLISTIQKEMKKKEITSKKPNHYQPTCVFCKSNHYSDKCTAVTDITKRTEIVKSDRLCYKCLRSNHNAAKCKGTGRCFRCKSTDHHTALCSNERGTFNGYIGERTSIMLQTAQGVVSDVAEREKARVRILFDPGSQRTYISRKIAEKLQLNPIARHNITVKMFGKENERKLDAAEYEICLKTNSEMNVYMKALEVPDICGSLNGQQIEIAKIEHPFLKNLQLADENLDEVESEIDLLIGADFYWGIIEGEIKKDDESGLVAIRSKIGWLISGPVKDSRDLPSSHTHHVNLNRTWMNVQINDVTAASKTNQNTEFLSKHEHSKEHDHVQAKRKTEFPSEHNDSKTKQQHSKEHDHVQAKRKQEFPSEHKDSKKCNYVQEFKTDPEITHILKMECRENSEENFIKEHVSKFWDLETLGISPQEDGNYYENFINGIKYENNRFEVYLPRKDGHPVLEDNYRIALGRLKKTKERLNKNQDVLKRYDEIIKDQLTQGIIEEVADPTENAYVGNTTYLPHREVLRTDKKSTALRIVFDASTKGSNGVSLNSILHTGPSLNPLLFEIFLKFRVHSIALTADVQKAYLQIAVNEHDKNLLRFLWYQDVFDEKSKIIKLRFNRVIFGATSSQFLLNITFRKLAQKYETEDSEFARKIKEHMYVDDLNTGTNSVTEGIELYEKMKNRFKSASFNLRKWRTNDPELREEIAKREKLDEAPLVEVEDKVLGIKWNEQDDELKIDIRDMFKSANSIEPTKRNILKCIAQIFDPIGFLQPVIIKLKILFQRICKEKTGWDELISDELLRTWKDIIKSIQQMDELVIPRCYFQVAANDPIKSRELHGFSDASQVAYATCIYMKSTHQSGNVNIQLITSKSRVVPMDKSYTIPRLELIGNFILSNLMLTVRDAISKETEIDDYYCWTDSQVSLAWIKSVLKVLKVFCQNRVKKIRENTNIAKWHYCNTKDNPADIISRFNHCNMTDKMWLHGPEYLRYWTPQQHDSTEYNSEIMLSAQFTEEIKSSEETVTHLIPQPIAEVRISNVIDLQKTNNIDKLFRVTAFVLRFINNLKRKVKKQKLLLKDYVTIEEMRDAKSRWIKDNQISLEVNIHFKQMKNSLKIEKDENGFLRSMTRIMNANLPYCTRAPIVLERSHRLSQLIVWQAHVLVKHQFTKQTLAELRSNYWIANGKSVVQGILRKCTRCRKYNGRPYSYPETPNLPKIRLRDDVPFSGLGTDYLGPLFCKNVYAKKDSPLFKCYVVLYTCASTRGVVLDLVHNAEASTFIHSFRRFIGRRGAPVTVLSDNGSSFIASETQEFVVSRNIEWKFNLSKAPWFGGFWERLVDTVKRSLKKTIAKSKLSYDELQTVLLEIELILNSRPLCYLFDDDNEDILTPNHLLYGRKLDMINETTNEDGSNLGNTSMKAMSKRLRYVNTVLKHFWGCWRKDYLLSLRENQKNVKSMSKTSKRHQPAVNDVVIINDDKIPRQQWNLGKIIELLPGSDGNVRGAKVIVGKTRNVIKRPINRLYPLEVQQTDDTKVNNTKKVDLNETSEEFGDRSVVDYAKCTVGTRRKREAAIVGQIKRKYMNLVTIGDRGECGN